MDWSVSKVIRIESGAVNIASGDLRILLSHYGITDEREVESLTRGARMARAASWPDYPRAADPQFLTYFAFETAASILRTFEPVFLACLIQTEEYERVSRNVGDESHELATRRWEERERRGRLDDGQAAPQMSFFILDEAVVRRCIGGPGTVRRQLQLLEGRACLERLPLPVVAWPTGVGFGTDGLTRVRKQRDLMREPAMGDGLDDPPGPLDRYMTLGEQGGRIRNDEETTTRHLVTEMADETDGSLEPMTI
jgi:hypothetical protein